MGAGVQQNFTKFQKAKFRHVNSTNSTASYLPQNQLVGKRKLNHLATQDAYVIPQKNRQSIFAKNKYFIKYLLEYFHLLWIVIAILMKRT